MRRFVVLALLLLGACAHEPEQLHLRVSKEQNVEGPKIQFLGVGGWLLHWQDEGLLFAPSFSNPGGMGLRGIPALLVAADNQRIDTYMPRADDVTMLLVGHAHYDHLMDVPRVMQKYTPKATVYGSETVAHILHAADPPVLRVQVPQPHQISPVGCLECRGDWFVSSGGHIRAMPIQSMHAGYLFGINPLQGSYDRDLDHVPRTLFGWKQGQYDLAWLVDLLDEQGRPVYRIHFQDAAANPPYGFPPQLGDGKGIDVEILSAGDWEQVERYPQALLRVTQPRLVLIGHWENFFGNDPCHPQTIPGQNPYAMLRVIQSSAPQARVVLPAPLSEVALPR